ncbi:hypothetical protein RF55_23754 [Lasius niger]|uniref:Uncharacterized protein n=1 Tax=Lasius niger TaxID=67767 RepID=A0A0J7MNP9_LASNI|nr:hypothetical protein RF55_23754 [Lasius niger]
MIEVMILSSNEICALLGRQACRELGGKLREKPEKNFELKRWSEHLSEATKKRLLEEEKKEEVKLPGKRKSTLTCAKYAKRAKNSNEKQFSDGTKNITKDEHPKDHGQFETREDPAEKENPKITMIEDPVKKNADAAESYSNAVKVRDKKGNISKKCSEKLRNDRQDMSNISLKRTREIQTLSEISNKIDVNVTCRFRKTARNR